MPCKEYEGLKSWYDVEMSTWAHYTYPQNQPLCGAVGDRKKKQIAREARDRATLKTKEMLAHRVRNARAKLLACDGLIY